jgi:hypothetical protein
MKTVLRKFYLLAPIALALAAAGTMPAQQTYTYTLNLPDIAGFSENDSSFFQYEFSWLGPLEYNAPAGSSCPTGCPVTGTTPGSPAPGFSNSGVLFTASTNAVACSSSPSGGCSEVDLSYFSAPSGSTSPGTNPIIADNFIGFRLIEPDSFWLNPTSNLFFANNPLGESGVGASILVGFLNPPLLGSVAPEEFGCNECSVSIAATPEPGTWLLLAASLAAVGVVFGRRTLRNFRTV